MVIFSKRIFFSTKGLQDFLENMSNDSEHFAASDDSRDSDFSISETDYEENSETNPV